ncbi:unnamed protein product, partial [Polarella glacialis]
MGMPPLTLALSGGMLFCYAILVLRRLWRCNWAAVRLAVVKHGRQMCFIDKAEGQHVKQFRRQRISWSTGISEALLHCVAGKYVTGLILLAAMPDDSVIFLARSLSRDLFIFLLLFLITVTPKRFAAYVLDFAHLLFTGCLIFIAFAAPPASCEEFSALQLSRLLAGLMAGNARLTCPCTLLVFAMKCVAVRKDASGIKEMWGDVWLTLFMLVVFIVYELLLFRIVTDTVPLAVLATKASLLSALCDAVVTLGPDLQIVEKAPKLANLLCQKPEETKAQGMSPSLQGSNFLDFISQTDKERFMLFIYQIPVEASSASRAEPAPAEALNVQMQGGSSISIQVQLFHSSFLEPDGKVGHLI